MQEEESGYRLSYFRGDQRLVDTIVCSNADTSRVRIYVSQDHTSEQRLQEQAYDPVHYPLDQLLLVNHLAPRQGAILHAASAVIDDMALVFAGVSGAGKSTLALSFVAAGLAGSLLSDDRVIVRADSTRAGMVAWGTPWPGDAKIAHNVSAPIEALLILAKSDQNEVVPLDPGAAMRRLMPAVSCPWYDKARGSQVLDTCARLVETLPCYELRFRPGEEVVALLASRSWSKLDSMAGRDES